MDMLAFPDAESGSSRRHFIFANCRRHGNRKARISRQRGGAKKRHPANRFFALCNEAMATTKSALGAKRRPNRRQGSGRERGEAWVRLAAADPLGRDLELASDPIGGKHQINLAAQLVG